MDKSTTFTSLEASSLSPSIRKKIMLANNIYRLSNKIN